MRPQSGTHGPWSPSSAAGMNRLFLPVPAEPAAAVPLLIYRVLCLTAVRFHHFVLRSIPYALSIALAASFCLCADPAAGGENWLPAPCDARRALPNDPSPPLRRAPLVMLAPWEGDDGIVRSVRVRDGSMAVALTFDLCELDTMTTGCDMELLGFLHEEGIPATLFMGGKWMRTHAGRVRQIMADPLFEIGSHAWNHGNCALLSDEGIRAQVLWTQAQYELLREDVLQSFKEAGEEAPAIPPVPTLFRLPYGRSSESALKMLAALGMRVVQWDVTAENGSSGMPALARRNGVLAAKKAAPGSILLFHANLVPKGTAALLRETVAEMRARGYRFVTVGELLGMGRAETVRDGYFNAPGDNRSLDVRFGIDGTGRKTSFQGR